MKALCGGPATRPAKAKEAMMAVALKVGTEEWSWLWGIA
jgi:hypothetical protein